MAKEGERFYGVERKLGGLSIVNKESMTFHWPGLCQERKGVFFSSGSAVIAGHETSPFWSTISIYLSFLFINFFK